MAVCVPASANTNLNMKGKTTEVSPNNHQDQPLKLELVPTIQAAIPKTSRKNQQKTSTEDTEDVNGPKTYSVRPLRGLEHIQPRPIFSQAPLDEKYMCVYCTQPLYLPMQSYCSHRFCRPCQERMFQDSAHPLCPRCELDAQEDQDEDSSEYSSLRPDTMFLDKAIEREMNKLEVKCPESECNWSGVYRNFAEHCNTCDFARETCPFGCDVILKKGQLESHLKDNVSNHIEMLRRKVETSSVDANSQVQNSLINDRIKAIEDQLSVISKSMDGEDSGYDSFEKQGSISSSKTFRLEKLEKNCETNMNIAAVLNREIEKLIIDTTQLSFKNNANSEEMKSMQKKIELMERQMALKDISLKEKDQRIQALEMTSFDGIFVWPIKSYSQLKREAARGGAQSLYSPPFYTSRSGYKLCARIYMNGDGAGKGNHVSLFLVLMRGPYDAILEWPFNHKVTFVLMDQKKQEHIVDAFRTDPKSSSFKRPVSDMNIASGCPLFAPHSKVEDTRYGYVNDDTMFIKIIVEPMQRM